MVDFEGSENAFGFDLFEEIGRAARTVSDHRLSSDRSKGDIPDVRAAGEGGELGFVTAATECLGAGVKQRGLGDQDANGQQQADNGRYGDSWKELREPHEQGQRGASHGGSRVGQEQEPAGEEEEQERPVSALQEAIEKHDQCDAHCAAEVVWVAHDAVEA